ncbi:hypothetical protein DUNSADRAFT_6108 [Dunaliella salina]|uniref:Encoded protein n=1 Tax=Dunaliella salina TaxID=3046 RepID=A0ABQ7H711_DUNSA|nr:hypothetical protein DUNSADRAFT_6108 [Dunaliella salina]|eukprot:KAF5842638.1 hypothetical protein DUNSADRAFT_6108 [Dunaliella salina]
MWNGGFCKETCGWCTCAPPGPPATPWPAFIDPKSLPEPEVSSEESDLTVAAAGGTEPVVDDIPAASQPVSADDAYVPPAPQPSSPTQNLSPKLAADRPSVSKPSSDRITQDSSPQPAPDRLPSSKPSSDRIPSTKPDGESGTSPKPADDSPRPASVPAAAAAGVEEVEASTAGDLETAEVADPELTDADVQRAPGVTEFVPCTAEGGNIMSMLKSVAGTSRSRRALELAGVAEQLAQTEVQVLDPGFGLVKPVVASAGP